MSEVNILYTFDTKYSKWASISMASVLKNRNPDTKYHIYCMVPRFTRGRRVITKMVSEMGGQITWCTVRRGDNPYRNVNSLRWSPVIFYRLFAYKYFPDVEKMLYMDSDTIACQDLSELFNTDVSNYALGAIRDLAPINRPYDGDPPRYVMWFSRRYMKERPYVNSGVLLLNLKNMAQEEGALLSAMRIIVRYPDQDILNFALHGRIKFLDLKYNYAPGIRITGIFPEEQIKEAQKSPVIVHFYTVKPWLYLILPRHVYAAFVRAAHVVNMSPEKLREWQNKHSKKRSSKTCIPYVRIKSGSVYLFGIKII